MAIKVLFVGNYDIPIHNIRPEAEMIIGLKRRGLDIEVMTRRGCYYAEKMANLGIRIHDYVPPSKFSLAAIRYMRRVLTVGHHHVLHLFNNKAIVAGVAAALGLPVKVVTYRGQTGNISRFDPVAYLTHLSPRVDRIVCVAEAVRQSLLPEVRDPAKLITIYKGHSPEWYADIQPADLATLGIPAGVFTVTCVANNRPRKGVSVLIRAAAMVPPESGVHLLLIGSGMLSSEVRDLVKASGAADRLHLFDHRDDVLNVVAASDATVLPAIKREGLPKTVIESMALGVAPVVTATGGSPELVEDRVSGLVVAPGDATALAQAILGLSRDRESARQMGSRARERIATDFTLEASVEAHHRLYESLVAES